MEVTNKKEVTRLQKVHFASLSPPQNTQGDNKLYNQSQFGGNLERRKNCWFICPLIALLQVPPEVGNRFANNEDSGNTSQNYPITQFWQEVNIENVQKSRAAGKVLIFFGI